MQTVKHLENSAGLALETCPEAVQVMPPESNQAPGSIKLPLPVTIAIDTLFAALLLAGLLSLPAWISTILT